jgi:SAM-dependent methyltransferase
MFSIQGIVATLPSVASVPAMPAASDEALGAAESIRARVAGAVPAAVKDAARPIARRVGLAAPAAGWWQTTPAVWKEPGRNERRGRWCNVCRWNGSAFFGIAHTESATCPQCGSIARDRFLLWCFTSRAGKRRGARVVETSPRLGGEYRSYMQRWFSYRTSDFDLSAHRGDIQLDLQQIDLPDASVDIVLTPHVLEHVPDTDRALAELFRVIAPGGRMYLQVPLANGVTSAPTEPEFHADNTPVFWNFGWDLTDRLRAAGFGTTVLVTDEYHRMLRGELSAPDPHGNQFQVDTLIEHVRFADLAVVAREAQSSLMGFEPGYHFATWECRRP